MKNIALVLAYDGTSFQGWQKTSMGPSIEETLECALQQLLQETVFLQAASRTDAGVHAQGQVVNFRTERWPRPLSQLLKGLNALLPPSIRVLTLQEMPLSFHPTLDALGKEYHYRVCHSPIQLPQERAYSWHIPYPLDVDAMEEAATYLIGEHDFSAFCNFRKNLNYKHKIRTLQAITLHTAPNQEISFRIVGNQFLYKMVRTLVGTLVAVGKHKISPKTLIEILASQHRPRAGDTAPAHGLTLHTIFFPGEISSILSSSSYDYT